ncbi:nitric oxide reductase transcriptional regulator NorR [Marinomonas fungiae]|uniref:Transcriptional regulator containing GAF, AAA-type ATPase, and DNA-binding Fis domains n=1 Tax=Marinomonas fungiae TaxID=1137284 RepID=A0A0K6IKU6_9GAMM|nr:nitric oxide reductase transcriptional regulator NorR [Marinomonas fungiae]CUB03718.1 Transcriptional regulator containing GAF, AAA-type ATPase, and DNA-binding Fis domains [Marinomonas fungiae]
MISSDTLLRFALDLASAVTLEDRFERLIRAIRATVACDAVVLLERKGEQLLPLAQQGLMDDVMGRRFNIDEHPRFTEICGAYHPVRFPTGCTLPDPYDGMVSGFDDGLPVHACMGIPLYVQGNMLGVVTLDSMTPGVFDSLDSRALDIVGTMAAMSLNTAMLLARLEQKSKHAQELLVELSEEALNKEATEMVGQSQAMQTLKQHLELVAPADLAVLIEGETGVGKELVARTLHRSSKRAQAPMVYVNCAAIPENLIESELFGHVKGAFTGADRDRVGKFTLAHGGTLFLDEIGELPLEAQGSLLRAIQNQEIQAVGKDKIEYVDVRIIAATNRDLKQEVAEKRFRADLYHRLSVFPIAVPPLRERNGDVLLLAGFFAEQLRRKFGLQQVTLSPQASDWLKAYSWPGNVRELEHVLSRATLLAKSNTNQGITRIEPMHLTGLVDAFSSQETPERVLPSPVHLDTAEIQDLKLATEDFQRRAIEQALDQAQLNWAQAARSLGMDRANLVRLAKRLGIEVTKQRS